MKTHSPGRHTLLVILYFQIPEALCSYVPTIFGDTDRLEGSDTSFDEDVLSHRRHIVGPFAIDQLADRGVAVSLKVPLEADFFGG